MVDLPDFNVTRWPLSECSPRTEEGIRRLAYIAIATEMYDVRGYLDALELLMLQAKRIKPDECGADWDDKVTPVEIEHIRRRGLLVRWLRRDYDDCEVCSGKGSLRASGDDGKDYRVDCPECESSGKVEREPEYIATDIDGRAWSVNFLQAASTGKQ